MEYNNVNEIDFYASYSTSKTIRLLAAYVLYTLYRK